MITREAAHKTLTARVGSIVSVDMERGFTRAWQQQGDNVAELLAKLEELSEALKTPWNEKTDEILKSADEMVSEYRSVR
jgi:hypothetical protein